MVDENLSRYLWKGLDPKRYSVAKIIPQDDANAVIIMYSNDPEDPHWCLQYKGNGHYFNTARQLMDYYQQRGFKNPPWEYCVTPMGEYNLYHFWKRTTARGRV